MSRRFAPVLLVALGAFVSFGSAKAALVGQWTFDNPANLGADSSGNGNNLAAQGDASYTSGGSEGGGLSVSGNGFLSSANFPTGIPIGNSAYTVAAWIKPALDNSGGIIGWGSYGSGDQVNALRLSSPNGFLNYWWANDIDRSASLNSVNIMDGNFHQIVATYDPVLNTRQLYLDGQALGSADSPGTHNATATNFTIGVTNSSEMFNGTIDDVQVWDNSMSATDVGTLFVTPVPEPATAGILLITLSGMSLRRRR